MDKMSRTLDEKYMGIQTILKKMEIHAQAVRMLKEVKCKDEFVLEQIKRHEDAIRELDGQVTEERLRQVDDFMLLDDVDVIRVMKLRYMDFKPWREIMDEMDRSERWVLKLRDRGLKCILSKKR